MQRVVRLRDVHRSNVAGIERERGVVRAQLRGDHRYEILEPQRNRLALRLRVARGEPDDRAAVVERNHSVGQRVGAQHDVVAVVVQVVKHDVLCEPVRRRTDV